MPENDPPQPSSARTGGASTPRGRRRLVGLIPAAGRASRLGAMPFSKELLPVGFEPDANAPGGVRVKPVASYLLEQFRRAGCRQAFFVVREGKWDIADYFGCGARFGLDIGYLLMNEPYGPPFSIDQATPFVTDSDILLGYPDILLDPPDAHAQVAQRLADTAADIVIAVFPAREEDGSDLVEIAPDGRVLRLVPKEEKPDWTGVGTSWLFAGWKPAFTEFLHEECAHLASVARSSPGRPREWPMGTIVAAAMRAGLRIDSVSFPQGRFLDVGVTARLARAASFPGVWDGTGPAPASSISSGGAFVAEARR